MNIREQVKEIQRNMVGDWGQFEDVREQERKAREQHRDFAANIKAAIAIADGLLQMAASSGYKALHAALEDMLKHRTSELLSVRDDRSAAVLQGRCQELRAMMSLMTSTKENREALAKTLAEEEDRFRELERTFKPTPTGAPT